MAKRSLQPLMSSEKHDWQTPTSVLDVVRQVGPTALDPCTYPENPTGASIICVASGVDLREVYYPFTTPFVIDGLSADWVTLAAGGLIFVNPPYGKALGDWMKKCQEEARRGAEIIALAPSRTDTRWFSDFVSPARRRSDAVCFWKGRIQFVGAKDPSPFPSLLPYWGPRVERFSTVFASKGEVWRA